MRATLGGLVLLKLVASRLTSCVNGPGCSQTPCPYICEDCCWGVCHACFNKAPKEGAEQAASKDSMADLLYSISQPKDWDAQDGDAEDDDAGDADDDDDDDDGARQNAMWDMALRAKAKEGQLDETLFVALATQTKQRVGEFNA